ncbi:alpha/beta hydrolase [Stenotrophomonas panacihumi]|uniref:alpha/beta hydrolase n=1 Tax=Stenotrophomonas panacihumi TaxID=676599 RepID=UPI0009D6408F|nr:alpha/beta hydrolase-fold protein [Stenotrophomonas panacihumi]PTN55685.1 alpha/beta hydrolase [Stenotrophomonas panacihumi]
MHQRLSIGLLVLCLAACGKTPESTPPDTAATAAPATAPTTPAAPASGQRGQGLPYEVTGSEVWNVPDPVSGRDYQVFVALPRGYADAPERRYPVLYVTDADYAFPLIRQIARRINLDGPQVDDFILVGLSYAVGEDGMRSRRRDYTPTAAGSDGAPADAVHGQADAYTRYLREQVLPFVAGRYRTDEARRLFLGHSYGSLLGSQILLSDPGMFSGYLLGSPSFWYDHHVMEQREKQYAQAHQDLPAAVYMYVGEYEEARPGDPSRTTTAYMVSDTRRMAAALRSRHYASLRLKVDVLNDEDHLSVAPRGFTHGLKFLLGAGKG